jgi:DNA topoisomerase-1
MEPRQHFTEPPPRYTEATFVKLLEELGIGRPSTYVSIISTIRDREYVELIDKRFYPTELGFKVTDQLVKHFSTVMDVKFTADMETKLDAVEEGQVEWVSLVRNFYDPFEEALKTAAVEMESLKPAPIETEYRCPVTGSVMLLREGRYGLFMGCSNYPKCKKILKLDEDGKPVEGPDFTCGLGAQAEKAAVDPTTLPNATEHLCPQGRGVMLLRQSRYGPFLGCSNYPKCRTSLKINPDGTLKEGQEFICTYSESSGKRGGKTNGRKAAGTAASSNGAASNGKAARAPARKTTKARPAAAKTTTTRRAKPKAE